MSSTAQRPARLVLLGTGVWATRFHLPILVASRDIEFAGIWGRSAKAVEAALAADALKGVGQPPRSYIGDEGLEELLNNPEVDGIISALPITAQPEIVLKALAAGKHVLSEKPLHKDVISAEQLIATYEKEYKPKGLIWRVAENYAHDPILNEVAKDVQNPAMGPVLYWQLSQQSVVAAGSLFHATAWRTIPDYQGGFILDGGVHMPAMLRSVIPNPPARIISTASLHRSHLPPHDVVMGIALPPADSYTPPHGEDMGDVSKIPVPSGKSAPTGTICLSWAAPDAQRETAPASTLEITCLNGVVYIDRFRLAWKVLVKPTAASGLKEKKYEGPLDGMRVQAEMFARAIGGSSEPNLGEPRSALWDLRFIEAMLTSEGKEVQLGSPPKQIVI